MKIERQIVRQGLFLLAAVLLCGFTPAYANDASDGWTSLFNGTDLTGWDGDPRLWSVKDGLIRGETTPQNPTQGNTFLVYRGGQFDDFELSLKFRLHSGNSGVQYRSKEFDKWRIAGYQADILEDLNLVGF
ncbi:MAG TPA: DUF1080 domain-containing protein, partial [Sedimentisphaerales bacterium]|nr:DUF1080 domain-containing protein [Sedimentisphaerales bacterium]